MHQRDAYMNEVKHMPLQNQSLYIHSAELGAAKAT